MTGSGLPRQVSYGCSRPPKEVEEISSPGGDKLGTMVYDWQVERRGPLRRTYSRICICNGMRILRPGGAGICPPFASGHCVSIAVAE